MMVGFLASRTGRWMRMLAGASLVVGGLSTDSVKGKMLAVVGLVPLLAGAFDLCLFGPFFGLPVKGEAIRRKVGLIGEDSLLPHPPMPMTERPTLLH
ncbi:YgaP-like transmembrane domain [Archangium lipolyticum]|uniref:YgaP-like transmembrane domain n=1 Tax=Archangium lipolyticum TaxID=2970465 RepID=UPI002149D618|nr:YgaP-like transmembrane domain [Archangium lipolyticum]